MIEEFPWWIEALPAHMRAFVALEIAHKERALETVGRNLRETNRRWLDALACLAEHDEDPE